MAYVSAFHSMQIYGRQYFSSRRKSVRHCICWNSKKSPPPPPPPGINLKTVRPRFLRSVCLVVVTWDGNWLRILYPFQLHDANILKSSIPNWGLCIIYILAPVRKIAERKLQQHGRTAPRERYTATLMQLVTVLPTLVLWRVHAHS